MEPSAKADHVLNEDDLYAFLSRYAEEAGGNFDITLVDGRQGYHLVLPSRGGVTKTRIRLQGGEYAHVRDMLQVLFTPRGMFRPRVGMAIDELRGGFCSVLVYVVNGVAVRADVQEGDLWP
jgi:hypothetical protein